MAWDVSQTIRKDGDILEQLMDCGSLLEILGFLQGFVLANLDWGLLAMRWVQGVGFRSESSGFVAHLAG